MKNKKKLVLSFLLIIVVFSSCVIGLNTKEKQENEKAMYTSATEQLSNKKIGWGIKREDNHNQPDLGSKNKELMNQYEGIAMGNANDKYVYLTFDEGYEAGYTPKILEVLKQNDVKAAFFITAHYVNTQEALVKQMIDEGHIIGNHIATSSMYHIKENRENKIVSIK